MTAVQLGLSDWRRQMALAPDIALVNRYFEQTPDPEHGPVSLLARPGLKKAIEYGQGPVRAMFSQPGSFDGDLFVVGYDTLYRIETDGTVQTIGAGIFGADLSASPSMAATAQLGSTPEYLYIADGRILWRYETGVKARGILTLSGAISAADEVRIDDTYYEWTAGSVDSGTPAGTSGSPWLVALGADDEESLQNLTQAIGATGTAGTTYSTALTAHPTVEVVANFATQLTVDAITGGSDGNSIVTTETSAGLSWGSGTLTGGSGGVLVQVPTPDDVGMVSVAYIAGYVICVCAQGEGVNGRFYWIDAGATTIDPLDFATAERAPDPAWSVRAVGDQFWILGSSSVEPWYLTGQGAAPFARQSARVFDRGVWQGTDVQVKDAVVIVDVQDGSVYSVGGQGPQRISDNSIEERIRKGMAAQTQWGR